MSRIGIEGALMVLSPLPLFFPLLEKDSTMFPEYWRSGLAVLAAVACLLSGLTLFRRPLPGKILGGGAALGGYAAALPYLANNPFAALTASVILVYILFTLPAFGEKSRHQPRSDHFERCRQRAWPGGPPPPYL